MLPLLRSDQELAPHPAESAVLAAVRRRLYSIRRICSSFDTAYAFAEAKDFDTFQIDNHYARFLLLRAIRSKDPGDIMDSFREARKFIFEQIETERRHYPFRVATLIGEFYDAFAGVLSEGGKNEIAGAAKHVLDRIKVLPDERQEQRYVRDCRKAMQHVLDLFPV